MDGNPLLPPARRWWIGHHSEGIMRPPFNAPEPDRGGETEWKLSASDLTKSVRNGNPILMARLNFLGDWDEWGDSIFYFPSDGWKWLRMNAELNAQMGDRGYDYYIPRRSGKCYDIELVEYAPPSPEALALATPDDWKELTQKVSLQGLVRGKGLWTIRHAPPNVAIAVMRQVCANLGSVYLARGVWEGRFAYGDLQQFTKRGKMRAVKKHLERAKQRGAIYYRSGPQAPPAPSVYSSGSKPQKPPPDHLAGLSKQEIARMSPADIVSKIRKSQSAEEYKDDVQGAEPASRAFEKEA
jgi:hypothetical protein